jgi:hypothetical protein
MAKLPSDYLKKSTFDNPLRPTGGKDSLVERKLTLQFDKLTWDAVWAVSEREGASPEELVQKAIEQWLSEPKPAVVTSREGEARTVSPRAKLFEKLQEQFARRSWFGCMWTLGAIVREGVAVK